jgi:hypothetical protein
MVDRLSWARARSSDHTARSFLYCQGKQACISGEHTADQNLVFAENFTTLDWRYCGKGNNRQRSTERLETTL